VPSFESGHSIGIQNDIITLEMGLVDFDITFDIEVTFTDSRCDEVFTSSSLRVTMDIDHDCGNEVDSIVEKDAFPISIFMSTKMGQVKTISNT
jgi:hypothetical protein